MFINLKKFPRLVQATHMIDLNIISVSFQNFKFRAEIEFDQFVKSCSDQSGPYKMIAVEYQKISASKLL